MTPRRAWATSKKKVSGELLTILYRHGYCVLDKSTGTHVQQLTRLQKEQTIQTVSKWFAGNRLGTVDLMLSELREQLEINGLPPLRDEGTTQFDADRARAFKTFNKRS